MQINKDVKVPLFQYETDSMDEEDLKAYEKFLCDIYEVEFGPLRPPPTPLVPLGQAERSQTNN